MRILIVHQHYLFPGQPGGSRFNEMGRLWAESGHDVCVIASTLNYATGQRHPTIGNRWCTRVREGNVTVWRCYVPGSYNASFAGRLWAFFGFVLSSSWAALRVPRPDVVIASSPPLTLVIPGWIAARFRRNPAPWVFEVRDLWPESAITTGVVSATGWFARMLYALERWACLKADAINVLTPAFRRNMLSRNLADPSKFIMVPNGADLALFANVRRDEAIRRTLGWESRIVALYAGAHGRANAIGQLVHAAEAIKQRTDVLIASIGDGPERIQWENEAARRGLTNIRFYGAQPKERMVAILTCADIGLAVLQDNPTFTTVYPNKLFDYMATGQPIVLAIDGAARSLACDEAECAVFVKPEDGRALGAAIVRLADDPPLRQTLGENGRRWVTQHASREKLGEQYLLHLSRMVSGAAAESAAIVP